MYIETMGPHIFRSAIMEDLAVETERSSLRDMNLKYFLKLYILLNIFADTKTSEKLSTLLTSNHLCNDMIKLSPKYQTSSVESFHNVIIHFASKSVAFSYLGMQCRYVGENYLRNGFCFLQLYDMSFDLRPVRYTVKHKESGKMHMLSNLSLIWPTYDGLHCFHYTS